MRAIPTWEPLSNESLADQRRTFDRMRAACPLAQSPRGVTLFRHADVVAAATDPATFSSAVSAHRQVPNSLDPPEHIAFRAIVDSFFRPRENAARNLVYGVGPHVCPGRPLATLELVVATATLLELTSSIELATEEIAERETYPVGGWRRLPVRLI
jgi:cytochrome P450